MTQYNIHEIFESVQGEGGMMGTPMLFIRFHGCNLDCPFCDTPQERSMTHSVECLLDLVNASPLKWVCLTGGEPGLQVTEELIQSIQEGGRKVAVETNGSVGAQALQWADYVTISPKRFGSIDKVWNDRIPNEVRLLMTSEDIYCEYGGIPGPNIFVSPVVGRGGSYDSQIVQNAIKYISEAPNNQYMRLSVQLHKLLNIR